MATSTILEHIHRKFAAGEFPAVAPPIPRAGYGLVDVCSGCDGPMREDAHDGSSTGAPALR